MTTTRPSKRFRTLDVACPEPAESPPLIPVSFTFPRSDDPLCGWMRLAVDTIARDPARYQLPPEAVAELAHHADAFQQALSIANSPATRCQQAIHAKNQTRDAARAVFQPIVDHIRHHPKIDFLAKYELGMNERPRRKRTPIEPPDSAPLINITNAGTDGTHTLRYADERTPHKRARPKDAGYLDLRIIAAPITIGIWPNPDASPEQLAAAGAFMRSEHITKPIFTIQHDRAHSGWCATYHARWCTSTSKPGPWGHSASMIIAFGGPVPRNPRNSPPPEESPEPPEPPEPPEVAPP